MQTRADSVVILRSQKVGKPLPIVEAWRNSSHGMLVFPDCVYAKVGVKVGNPIDGTYGAAIWGTLHPVQGYWYFYIPKSEFKSGGESAYKVVATDINGKRHVCGEGVLRVYSGSVDDSADEEGSGDASHASYILHGGDWYEVNVGEDASGSLAFELNRSPITPETEAQGTPYAYCKRTGLFHALSIFEDESGTLSIAVSDVGEDGDSASFAYDKATGFYYMIDCAGDESGTLALQVGDRQ